MRWQRLPLSPDDFLCVLTDVRRLFERAGRRLSQHVSCQQLAHQLRFFPRRRYHRRRVDRRARLAPTSRFRQRLEALRAAMSTRRLSLEKYSSRATPECRDASTPALGSFLAT